MVPLWYVRGSRCKACASRASHSAVVEKTYGITGEQYAAMLAEQGGKCAICKRTPRAKRLAVDHNHKTGAVRGLLCSRCNRGILGHADDSLERLRSAVAYMERYEEAIE